MFVFKYGYIRRYVYMYALVYACIYLSMIVYTYACKYFNSYINLLNTKRRLLYLKTQVVPRSKHF